MLLNLVFILFGFFIGAISTAILILLIRNKDEALIQDLNDRILARTPGDYLSIIHFRKEHMSKKPYFLFDALKKKTKVTVPSPGEIEMAQAKAEAAKVAREQEFDDEKAHGAEFERQQDRRFRQNKDTVIP